VYLAGTVTLLACINEENNLCSQLFALNFIVEMEWFCSFASLMLGIF
jgi:hypothetical protein